MNLSGQVNAVFCRLKAPLHWNTYIDSHYNPNLSFELKNYQVDEPRDRTKINCNLKSL
jgi:hypothetical protein